MLIDAEDVLYVLKVNIGQMDENLADDAETVLAVLEEEDGMVKAAVMSGGEFMGTQDTALIGCPAQLVEAHIAEGIADRISAEAYFTPDEQ